MYIYTLYVEIANRRVFVCVCVSARKARVLSIWWRMYKERFEGNLIIKRVYGPADCG